MMPFPLVFFYVAVVNNIDVHRTGFPCFGKESGVLGTADASDKAPPMFRTHQGKGEKLYSHT